MVESFAGYSSDEEFEEQITEMLLDHSFGQSKIKGFTYCDELDVVSIGFNDGSILNIHVDIQLDKDNEEDDDDEQYENQSKVKGDKVILKKRSFEQFEGELHLT